MSLPINRVLFKIRKQSRTTTTSKPFAQTDSSFPNKLTHSVLVVAGRAVSVCHSRLQLFSIANCEPSVVRELDNNCVLGFSFGDICAAVLCTCVCCVVCIETLELLEKSMCKCL